MYVQFRRREREASVTLYAYIVENVREAGGPRQHVLCYLGGIKEEKLSDIQERYQFYKRCMYPFTAAVATLPIDGQTEARLIAQLADVVPLETEHIIALRMSVEQERQRILGH